eukprot:gene10061-2231_t
MTITAGTDSNSYTRSSTRVLPPQVLVQFCGLAPLLLLLLLLLFTSITTSSFEDLQHLLLPTTAATTTTTTTTTTTSTTTTTTTSTTTATAKSNSTVQLVLSTLALTPLQTSPCTLKIPRPNPVCTATIQVEDLLSFSSHWSHQHLADEH